MRRFILPCCLLLTPLLLPVEVPGQAGTPKLSAKELRALLEEARKEHDLPALGAAVVRGGQEAVLAVTGVRKRGADTLAGDDDLWHLGSNTKPMTALLLALLTEAGVLDWDTTLGQLFADLAGDWDADLKKLTPDLLLTHTSTLPANWPLGWYSIAGKGTPAEQRVAMMRKLNVPTREGQPGKDYLYSNLGYTVLGAIIDRVGKAPWEEQIQRKVFQPLGIRHAGFGPPIKPGANGKPVKPTQPWPHDDDGKPVTEGVVDNPPIMDPAGCAHMPLADYARFLAEILHLARGQKGLLKPATVAKFFANPHPASPHGRSGWLGFRKELGAKGLTLLHDGSNTFNYCTAVVRPDDNLAVCVCTNQGGDTVAKACAAIRKAIVKRATQ